MQLRPRRHLLGRLDGDAEPLGARSMSEYNKRGLTFVRIIDDGTGIMPWFVSRPVRKPVERAIIEVGSYVRPLGNQACQC